MVSNSLNMELQELLDILEAVRRECGSDSEYLELRQHLPREWPM
jgi:hypothetical protein